LSAAKPIVGLAHLEGVDGFAVAQSILRAEPLLHGFVIKFEIIPAAKNADRSGRRHREAAAVAVAIQKLALDLRLLVCFEAESPHHDGKQPTTYGGWHYVYPG
jgi:hypothetical protein